MIIDIKVYKKTGYETYTDINKSNVDTIIVFSYEMIRIPSNEYTLSDLKEWKVVYNNDGYYKYGRKQKIYNKEFYKRREKYAL